MRNSSTNERQSLYGEVTARINAELEKGRLPWVQPWDSEQCACAMPHNAVTDHRDRRAMARMHRARHTAHADVPVMTSR